MIGIIGAMAVEVSHLKEKMTDVRVDRISGIDFHVGRLMEKDVVVATSGIGKVHAAICAQTMILKYNPSVVLNTGVAGGLRSHTRIGDVVIAKAVVQHDMDTSPVGDPVGLISGINIVEIPVSERITALLQEASAHLDEVDATFGHTSVHVGIIGTGDQFFSSQEQFDRIHSQFGAIAAEMEGGSIGQVCFVNGIEFGIVRAISDNGDESSHMDYMAFVGPAAKRSHDMVMRFVAAY